jgi:hypothetical protein
MDPYIYNGGGVAVLDVNRDGLQDLFFTARLQGCQLYLNKGHLQFENISKKSGVEQFGGLKTGVTVVDINHDGFQDLYVCRTWLEPLPERRNLLLVNQKNGTFTDEAAAYGLDDLSASQMGNFFDFDLDGDLDLYVMNHPVDWRSITEVNFRPTPGCSSARCQPPNDEFESDKLYENDGKGHFTDISRKAGIHNRAFGLSVLTSDFNADGYPDILVGNDFIMPDFLYINNRQGGFTDQGASYFRHTSNHSMGADVADVNEDGLQDIVVLDMLAADWTRRRTLMSTMILERTKELENKGYGRQMMRNTLQINNGNNTYSEIGRQAGIEATDWSWAPLLADFDNDGNCDLFVANGIFRDLNNTDFFLYTADSINKTGGISAQRFGSFEKFASLLPSTPVRPYLYRNTGNLHFEDVSEAWGFDQRGFANGAAYADLDNDGDLDLVTNNLQAPPTLYENRGSANHWLQIKCKGPQMNPTGIGAKVNVFAAGKLIFSQEVLHVRGYYSSVEPILQVGLGELPSVDKIEVTWPGGRQQTVGPVQADQRIVLDVSQATPPATTPQTTQTPLLEPVNWGDPLVHRENNFEDFNRDRLLPHRLSTEGPCLSVADFTGDGLDDLFLGGAAGQAGSLWIQENKRLRPLPQPALDQDRSFEDTGSLAFDADGDGDMDLYVSSGGNEETAGHARYQDRLYLNDGRGKMRLSPGALPAETHSGAALLGWDFDQDGDTDVFAAGRHTPGSYPQAPVSMLLENRGGHFTDVTQSTFPEFAQIGMVTDMAYTDLEGDGNPELLLCGDWMPITVFTLKNGKFVNKTTAWGLEKTGGWWNCLEIADVNQDGKPDILAGNEGKNTRFKPTQDHPLKIYAADFDRNGSIDPVIAHFHAGKYVPVAQRNEMAAQLPSLINKQFTRFATYAQAGIRDIFSHDALSRAMEKNIHGIESGWFEQKNGQLIFHPFPWEAQTAPVQSILTTDLNADGNPDFMLVGNHYGNEVETGRQDAGNGAVLTWKNQRLSCLPNTVTGFWATREARVVVEMMINGKTGYIVGNNNDRAQGYRRLK